MKNKNLPAKDRLIVALDVSSRQKAMEIVQTLDNVSFFKIGLQLFLTGEVITLIRDLKNERDGKVFLDVKWGGDIGNTSGDFMQACIDSNIVKFITLVEARSTSVTKQTIDSGKAVREAAKVEYPHFLMVPFLSSLDAIDLKQTLGSTDVNGYILERGKAMVGLGCDGLIVSGDAIRPCRDAFGWDVDIVSPGIRPAGASLNDQKRVTTPTQAIEFGSDYLVVGRPIIDADNPRDAAEKIIDEIGEALSRKKPATSPSGSSSKYSAMAAKSL